MYSNTIYNSLKDNEENLKNIIGSGFDIEFRQFTISAFDNCNATIVFINKMVDNKEIDEFILAPLMKCKELPRLGIISKKNNQTALLKNSNIFVKQAEESNEWTKICDAIMDGDTALFVDKCSSALILSTKGFETRSIMEPLTESEIRGPRDGFVENIKTNSSLIRRRIKDYSLRFESLEIGDRTKTDIALVYIDNLVNKKILGELKSRLEQIKVDSILASSYIEEYIEDSPNSIFPQIDHTERPDKASSAILEGRIVILVDNTPFALIVPTIFWNFLQTSGDYYERYFIGTFIRWVRYFSLICGLTLSSLYVLLASFHQEMLPVVLALKFAEGRESVPFPAVMEALFLEATLEIVKEAGLRMPRPIGQTVSIVGTFIIGQAAVAAGVVAPILVIFVTISAICSYVIPSYSLSNSIRLVRFPLLIATSILGLFGFFAGIIVIMLHLLSLRSFGEPFLAPVIPYYKGDGKDILIRAPWWKMLKRPRVYGSQDSIRQANNLKPKPLKGNK